MEALWQAELHPTEDVENAEVVLFIGTIRGSRTLRNARLVLREIQKDPNRK